MACLTGAIGFVFLPQFRAERTGDRSENDPTYLDLLVPLLPSHGVFQPGMIEAVASMSGPEPLASTGVLGQLQTYIFRPGDSFFDALAGFGVSAEQIDAIIRASRKVYNFARVVPERQIRFRVEPSNGRVQWLEYEVAESKRVKVERKGEAFVASTESIPAQTEIRFAEGVIEDSLYLAARAAGVPSEVILDFADLFAWDLDFAEEIRPGDRFRVVFEVRLRDGHRVGTGRILAAEMVHQGKTLRAFYFAMEGERGEYYDPSGKTTRKAFLKSPLRYRYISSGFSYSRYHPILRVRRPHLGVDYAAPRGTPVMAAADGKVEFVGRKGGLGNCIILRHRNGYSTLYGHLQGFANGLRKDQKVQQKQIIGYVGSTGISTGPHLHYTFMRNGVPMNPIKASPQVARAYLEAESLTAFQEQIRPYQDWMDAVPLSGSRST